MEEVKIFLTFNNLQEGFQLPVNPESFEVEEKGDTKTYDVQGLGEINILKGFKLPEITIASIFPGQYYPFCKVEPRTPSYYITSLKKWIETKRPIRLTIEGIAFPLSWAVSVESFSYKEAAGAPGDVEYKLTLKQYKFYGPRKVIIDPVNGTTITNGRPADRSIPAEYTVKRGEDTFWYLCKKILGNGDRDQEIAAFNGMRPDRVLFPGEVIRFPVGG